MKKGQLALSIYRGHFLLVAVDKEEKDGLFGGRVIASNIQPFVRGTKSSRWMSKYFKKVQLCEVVSADGQLTIDFTGNSYTLDPKTPAPKKTPVKPKVSPKPRASKTVWEELVNSITDQPGVRIIQFGVVPEKKKKKKTKTPVPEQVVQE